MSSRNESDPADLTPEQRQERWLAESETRFRIQRGVEMFGADRFHAFLTLPGVDPDSESLHNEFMCCYHGSYRSMQRALEGFVDCTPLADVLRSYLRLNEPSRNGVGLNLEAVAADFDRRMHAVEMGDRIHVFWRVETNDE